MMKLMKVAAFLAIIVIFQISCQEMKVTHSELDFSKEENRFISFEKELFNKEKLKSEEEHLENFRAQINETPGNNYNDVKSTLKFLQENISEELSSTESSCENRPNTESANFYYFFPLLKSKVNSENVSSEFSLGCFKSIKLTIVKLSKEETIVSIHSANPKNLWCKDSYWLATSNIHHVSEIFFHGEHRVTLKNLSDDDIAEIKFSGFRFMTFCQGFFTTLHSFYMSLRLYVGGLGPNPDSKIPIMRPEVPEYMEKSNIKFLNEFANFKPLSRGENGKKILDVDEKEIKSGDFLAIYRLDGLDPLIMYGSGSRVGHSAVACWIDGELYVLESQDGWYWPKRGIQRNKWSQWIQWAHNADFNVAILPLREEIRQKFDVEKAINWFTSGIEGLNYGYHNFLFGWLDTPYSNLPSNIIQFEVFLPLFSIFERITRSTADTILGEALNMRLGTKGLSIPQITGLAARKNLSFEDVVSLPELEEWKYSDGQNYVCSSFVIAFWKAGGIFGDLFISPSEFTPKDVYQLNFFDLEYKDRRPEVCKQADPTLPYCQVIGKYQVILDGYNTVNPYPHMNEKCPSIAPTYDRPDNC
jgi:hypothetical protein